MAATDSYGRSDSSSIVKEVEARLEKEITQLKKDIWRVGDPEKPQVPFGELFDDEDVQQHYEGLAATLKAAKKRNVVTYKSPILLKGAHDKVLVELVDADLNDLKESGNKIGSS